MQHLDEGTIHSWLDGALSADEAARVEAHVKECPQCASAVAEARGFIAASSRILTALDNAPRGVVPLVAPRRRIDPLVWRVAATVLVVAAGTLVVVRNRGTNEQLKSASMPRTSIVEQAPAAAGSAAAAADEASPKVAASDTRALPTAGKVGAQTSRSNVVAREKKTIAGEPTAQSGQVAAAPTMAGAAAPTTLTLTPFRVRGVATMDAATESKPLKVVSTPRKIGAKITVYEIELGDTVTLTESMPVSLNRVVVIGAAVAPTAQRATEKSAAAPSKTRADAAITPAPESQRAEVMSSAPAVSAPAPSQQAMANTLHTITWTDPTTGNTLTLTGRGPEARLQEIRIRIERERAAAAAKKSR